MDAVIQEEERVLKKKLKEVEDDLGAIDSLVGFGPMPKSLEARHTALERKVKELVIQLKALNNK